MREEIVTTLKGPWLDLNHLERQVETLERERDELGQKIPLWDRIVFFSDTADESREREVKQQLKLLRTEREAARKAFEKAEQELVQRFPVFGLGRLLEKVVTQGKQVLEADDLSRFGTKPAAQRHRLGMSLKGWRQTLELALGSVLRMYLPKAPLDLVVEDLGDKDRCLELAGQACQPQPAEGLGWMPLGTEKVRCLVAAQLVELRLFEHTSHLVWLEQELERETESTSLLEQRAQTLAEVHRLVLEGLSGYPPLKVYAALRKLVVVAKLAEPGEEFTLHQSGRPVAQGLVTYSALLQRLLAETVDAFRATFPEVPFSWEMADDQKVKKALGAELRLYEVMDEAGLEESLTRAGEKAAALAGIEVALQSTRKSISLLDRVVFWSDTEHESQERALKHAYTYGEQDFKSQWWALVELAQGARAQFPGFYLSDGIVNSIVTLESIKTREGESQFQRSCPLHNKEGAVRAVGELHSKLRQKYAIPDTLRGLLLEALKAEPIPEGIVTGENVFGHLAREIEGLDLAEQLKEADSLHEELAQKRRVAQRLSSQVSTLDRLNIFTQSDSEKEAERAAAEVRKVSFRQDQIRDGIWSRFEQVLTRFPEVRVFQFVSELRGLVASIESRSASRTKSYTDSDGNTRRTTYYYCYVAGKGEALEQAYQCSSFIVHCFSTVPSLNRVLDRWAIQDHPLRDRL